jgi:hypothetical protein
MSYVRKNYYATPEQSQADARRLAWEKQQEENRKKEEENRKQAQETEAQARKEQDALEKERLQQLADAQPDASAFQGSGLMTSSGSSFDPNMGYTGSGVYNRPRTGWDYDKDTYKISYFEMFGEPSLADQRRFESEFNSLIESDVWTDAELTELEGFKNSFYNNGVNPDTWDVVKKYGELNVKRRQETKDTLESAGIEAYTLPTTLEEAKVAADNAYIEYLEDNMARSRGVPTFIAKGAPSFDTVEDIKFYQDLPDNDVRKEAMDVQGAVMQDFLTRQGGALDYTDKSLGKTFSWGWGNKAGTTTLNTGTIIGVPDITGDNVQIGEFGQYGNYSYDNPPPVSSEMKAINTTLDVLSVVYPPVAPVFQGIKTTVNTGDIEEGLKSAGKTFLVKKIGSEVADITENFIDDLDIDVDFSKIPEPAKEILGDTIGGIASGKNGDEALGDAFVKQIGTAIVDDLDIDEDAVIGKIKTTLGMDEDTEIPDFVKNIAKDTTDAIVDGKSGSNAFDSSVKSEVKDFVGDVTEEGIKYVAGEAGELLVSAGELAGDVFGSTIDALGPVGDLIESGVGVVSDITSDFEDVVRAGGSAIDDTLIQPVLGAVEPLVEAVGEAGQGVIDLGKDIGEAVVDTTDDLIDTFGKEVVDPALQEGKKVAEAVVDKADEALDYLGEEYVDPALQQGKEIGQDIIDKGKDIGEGIVDTVDNVVDKFGEEAVDPVLAKAKDLGQDLIDKGKDAGEFVVDTVDDALDYLGEEYVDPALQALKDIELPEGPDIDFPEFTAPDIDLPEIDIDLPSIDVELPELSFDPKLLAGLMPTPQQPTQVEGLFDKELFKFDTEIKSTQEMLSPFMNLRRYG